MNIRKRLFAFTLVLLMASFGQAVITARQSDSPALHLRAVNMLYEGLKEKGAMMIVPSTAVESMGMGGLLGSAALRQQQLAKGEDEERLVPVG